MSEDKGRLSFSLKRRRVLIHRSTLRALGRPQGIRFLLNTGSGKVAVQSCEVTDRDSFVVPDLKPKENYDISSVSFLQVVYKLAGWDPVKTYRVEGNVFENGHLVEFILKDAVVISDEEFVDTDADA